MSGVSSNTQVKARSRSPSHPRSSVRQRREEIIVCHPLKSLSDVAEFLNNPPVWRSLCIELRPHSEEVIRNLDLVQQNYDSDHEIQIEKPEAFCHFDLNKEDVKRHRRKNLPKTLVCHDMANGYHDDCSIDGTGNHEAYTFYNWAVVDIFCYFSHHFVTVPPLGWINVGHAHGVKVIGTVITEWGDGADIWEELLGAPEAWKGFASNLVAIAKTLKFDGYLLNVENKISKPLELVEFVRYLRALLHGEVPGSVLLWYDSVTVTGELAWQNTLNEHNKAFFDACDGIFTNYTWNEAHVCSAAVAAGARRRDVFVGLDVWGRNFTGGGQLNTQQALKVAHKYGLSVAIFAPAWTHEALGPGESWATYTLRERALWTSLWPFLNTKLPSILPFTTSFCTGLGRKRWLYGEVLGPGPWYNLRHQQYQPSAALGPHGYRLAIRVHNECPRSLLRPDGNAQLQEAPQSEQTSQPNGSKPSAPSECVLIQSPAEEAKERAPKRYQLQDTGEDGCIELYLEDSYTGGGCLLINPENTRLTRLFHCDFVIEDTLIACVVTKTLPGYEDTFLNIVLTVKDEDWNESRVVLMGGGGGGRSVACGTSSGEVTGRELKALQRHLLLNQPGFYVSVENAYGWKVSTLSASPSSKKTMLEPNHKEVNNDAPLEMERVESPLTYLNLDDNSLSLAQDTTQEAIVTSKTDSTQTKCKPRRGPKRGLSYIENTEQKEPSQNIIYGSRKRKLPTMEPLDGTQSYNSTAKKRKHVAEEQPYEITLDNVEEENGNPIIGHRIVDIQGFITDLQEISTHESLFNCGLASLKIISEKRKGLNSVFKIRCELCKKTFHLKNSSDNLNKCAVSGAMAAGCGNAELNQFIAAMNLPNMSEHTYNRNQDEVCNDWELTAWEEMKKAGQKEREAAIREGKVDKNGIPLIDVVLDGCWSKRSYRTNYSASSGAAAIIGRRFGQVLFMSVKNKFCCICARANKNNETVKEHSCYKNFNGPSTAMEAAIIVEGFKQSLDMHGCIYSRFIADGDSNTYAKILEARPYPNRSVEKLYCKNHILRNFCNKLQLLKTDTKYRVYERKLITNGTILSARKYIINCIKLHNTSEKSDRVSLLHRDISNSLKHGFGSHDDCNKNICSRENKISDPNLFNTNLWHKMKSIVKSVAAHARSLVENVDSNVVECFNSVIAKFIGGKRVNYAQRRSYQARCAGAIISFNTGKILTTVHENFNEPVGNPLLQFEAKKQKKRESNRNSGKKIKRITKTTAKTDYNYGEHADAPDMDPVVFDQQKDLFIENLQLTKSQRDEIEKRTTLQAQSAEWMELRRNLLTASNFGKVVKRLEKNSCQNIVKNMLYKANLDHVSSIAHGRNHEEIAIEQLATLHQIEIKKCGLFIDEKYPFLGATPDGIVNDDMLVEVKCPVAAFKIGIDEAIAQGKVQLWRVKKDSGEIYVNKRSDWYFQAQGQMHVAKKQKCLFGVWYGDDKIKSEIIDKDDDLWNTVMEPKLLKFYFDCLLPELVDPRFTRNRPIRDPSYVIIKKKNKENVNP